MKKRWIVAFLFFFTINTSVFANDNNVLNNCGDEIKTHIISAQGTLRMLITFPGDIYRKTYLDEWGVIVDDFHKVSASIKDNEPVDRSLQQCKDKLDQIALILMDKLNQQNRLGMDLNNRLGGNLFNDINDECMMRDRITPDPNNKGKEDISISIINPEQLGLSDYELSFDTSTHYFLKRKSGNQIVSAGTIHSVPFKMEIDGILITINNRDIFPYDRFTLSPRRNAASNIKLLMTDPAKLALGWPVTVNPRVISSNSDGYVNVTDIVDTATRDFSIPKQLNPPIKIQFTVYHGVPIYFLYNANTDILIEGPIDYVDGSEVFPTPGGYDPGYRISISGNHIHEGDAFNISYNLYGEGDSRNGLAMSVLLDIILQRYF